MSGWSADWSLRRYAGRSILGSGSDEEVEVGSGVDAAEEAELDAVAPAVVDLELDAFEEPALFDAAIVEAVEVYVLLLL